MAISVGDVVRFIFVQNIHFTLEAIMVLVLIVVLTKKPKKAKPEDATKFTAEVKLRRFVVGCACVCLCCVIEGVAWPHGRVRSRVATSRRKFACFCVRVCC